ncbi:long-chain fatty acid transporter [Imperialibacter roseus]|uniref:Long-chain fatty acid transporter n=1 Tax=Imperialibacter roseus TaxID=1324217 RepID=A0ABZ0IPN1_9BACT|nr:long-chain fatty acid transporter [Imperialibacter roseus]WOK06945.1 long-chain fatty acid transporter [Imperialibacter roseus]
MKKLTKLTVVGMLMVCSFGKLSAQVESGSFGYYTDALRFSSISSTTGSARMQGLGGANTSLGGDITTAASNPAGLGYFNRSVFAVTPSLNFNTSDATFADEKNSGYLNKFNLSTLGVAFNFSKGDVVQDKFKGGTFAINYQRVNDFYNEFTYEGYNDNSSIIDYFLEQSNGIPLNSIDNRGLLSLAYYNYLINPVAGQEGTYDSFVLGYPRQSETVKTVGGQNQWSFSYGGNYDDKIYFGAGLGIVGLRYKNTKRYTENSFYDFANDADDPTINSISADESLEITGTGVNATFGFIYRPLDLVRFGVSYTTPTIYDLNEISTYSLTTNYNNFYYEPEDTVLNVLTSDGDLLESSYQMTTPGRLSAGVSVFAGKNGFVSADVELVNYSGARLRSSDFSANADNRTIENLYKSTLNYRVGAEARLDIFRLRAGYVLYGNPYASSDSSTGNKQSVTAGAGIRLSNFYVDLGIINTFSNQNYSPYILANNVSPEVSIKNRTTSGLITFGFTF